MVGDPGRGTQGQSRVGTSHLTPSHDALGPCPAEDKQSGLREFDLQVSLPTVTAGGWLLRWVEVSWSGPLSWVHFPQLTPWGPSLGLLPGGRTSKAALLLPRAIPLLPRSPTLNSPQDPLFLDASYSLPALSITTSPPLTLRDPSRSPGRHLGKLLRNAPHFPLIVQWRVPTAEYPKPFQAWGSFPPR